MYYAGGFGHDFSRSGPDVFSRVDDVSKKLLKYGVTSFCPTIVTSPPSVYQEVCVTEHLLIDFRSTVNSH